MLNRSTHDGLSRGQEHCTETGGTAMLRPWEQWLRGHRGSAGGDHTVRLPRIRQHPWSQSRSFSILPAGDAGSQNTYSAHGQGQLLPAPGQAPMAHLVQRGLFPAQEA